MEALDIDGLRDEDDLDLSIDEFDEEEESLPSKFEKRNSGKGAFDDTEFGTGNECPFCGDLVTDLRGHIEECEFAPDDVNINDVLPSQAKKRKKRSPTAKSSGTSKGSKPKQKCPYCGKEFLRLGRHLQSCKKKPADAKEE